MKIIGITGPTGAGKTTALDTLRSFGVEVLDCDAIYHRMLQQDQALNAALRSRFPEAYRDGGLDRKALGALVWQDEQALAELNRITHSAILAELERRIADARERDVPGVAIDAVALLESGAGDLCGVTVAVTAPEERRIARIMARDGIDEPYARARVAAQKDAGWFAARCDHTLNNDSTEAAFREKCHTLFLQLLGDPEETAPL